MWLRVVNVNVMRGVDDEVPSVSCPFPWRTFDANAVNAAIDALISV